MFSLADSTPTWAMEHWPLLVQASISNQYSQMKAVAAMVQTWDWHRVNVIFEDGTDLAFGRVILNLLEPLQEVGADISHLVPLPSLIASSFSTELLSLKGDQCRVFVVHTSLNLATYLFHKAQEMKKKEKDYVWIVTNTITGFLHSFDVTTIRSMQGVLGVMNNFPESSLRFSEFKKRFQKKFSVDYPEERNNEPGISAVEAYDDALWAVALTHALSRRNMPFTEKSKLYSDKISFVDFNGLTGRVQFVKRKLAPSHVFGIVNVIGKSYRELGIWSEGSGFSKSTDDNDVYDSSMQHLGHVYWPGEPLHTPKGWALPNTYLWILANWCTY
ncbi:glutamate receptor 2.2-like [Apium graveolens]|uniref:glutamate receptor 2.2-like n=1 Tax=Apium graveolens TaxID=4045 RepID=UPI003D7A5B87